MQEGDKIPETATYTHSRTLERAGMFAREASGQLMQAAVHAKDGDTENTELCTQYALQLLTRAEEMLQK